MTQEEFESTLRDEIEKKPNYLVIYFNDGFCWEYPIDQKPLPSGGFEISIDGLRLPGDAELRAFSSVTSIEGYNGARRGHTPKSRSMQ
ncbi:MAG: hypothetical protein ABF719_10730 [Acetobacter sp.]|uniref:hypothetical protein n=1 Tax=Acetobacter sp. TaxID=440 RepID=UPI0039EA022B